MVPFLYQTSSHPFNEEVDFFNLLIGYSQKMEKQMVAEVFTMPTVMGGTGASSQHADMQLLLLTMVMWHLHKQWQMTMTTMMMTMTMMAMTMMMTMMTE